MSSILDALRQLESSGAPVPAPATASPERSSRMPIVAGGLAAAFVVGIGLAFVIRHERGGEPKVSTPVAAAPGPKKTPVLTTSATPVLPVAPALPPPVVHASAEAPWARLSTSDAPSAPSAAPAVARERTPAAEVERAVQPAVARSEDRITSPKSPSEPWVRLASVEYSPSPGRRTVSVVVNGGSPMVLHEGQSANDVQVTLILPDRVYLRHAGQVFAVRPGQ